MQYLACKNPWFAVENFFSTRRVVTRVLAYPRHVSFPQDVGFPHNESWHLHATCMVVVIYTVVWQTNSREILLRLYSVATGSYK